MGDKEKVDEKFGWDILRKHHDDSTVVRDQPDMFWFRDRALFDLHERMAKMGEAAGLRKKLAALEARAAQFAAWIVQSHHVQSLGIPCRDGRSVLYVEDIKAKLRELGLE